MSVFILIVIAVIVFLVAVSHGHKEAQDKSAALEVRQSDEEASYREELAKPLVPIAAPYPLGRGVKCYRVIDTAVLLENRRVRTGTVFAGPTVSLPLVRSIGLRFRAGYLAHAPTVASELVPIDAGRLLVTSHGLLLVGADQTRTLDYASILEVTLSPSILEFSPYLVTIRRRKGRAQSFAVGHPGELTADLARLNPALFA